MRDLGLWAELGHRVWCSGKESSHHLLARCAPGTAASPPSRLKIEFTASALREENLSSMLAGHTLLNRCWWTSDSHKATGLITHQSEGGLATLRTWYAWATLGRFCVANSLGKGPSALQNPISTHHTQKEAPSGEG